MAEQIDLRERHQPFKPNQFKILVDPMPKNEHIKQKDIALVDESTWYKYTLKCGHWVLSKVRIRVGENYSFREHYIFCPHKHEPLQWQAIAKMEAISDDDVRNVQSILAYVLPNRILRADGHGNNGHIHNSGNPFPYLPKSSDRQYW